MNMINDQTNINATILNPTVDTQFDEFSIENKFKFKDIKKNPRKVKKRRQIEEALHSYQAHQSDELAGLGWH